MTKNGVIPDKGKVQAINEMQPPCNVIELRRTLGKIDYLGPYVDNLSTIQKPEIATYC